MWYIGLFLAIGFSILLFGSILEYAIDKTGDKKSNSNSIYIVFATMLVSLLWTLLIYLNNVQ